MAKSRLPPNRVWLVLVYLPDRRWHGLVVKRGTKSALAYVPESKRPRRRKAVRRG